jgi:dihydropteroate synthase
MHWRGHSDVMNELTHYDDVAHDVKSELAEVVDAACAAGINRNRLVLDPGVGFAKTVEQNWPLLAHLEVLDELNLPLLVGVSRKRFLGELLQSEDGQLRPTAERESATTAFTTLLAQTHTWAIRVHDARAAKDAVLVVERLRVSK